MQDGTPLNDDLIIPGSEDVLTGSNVNSNKSARSISGQDDILRSSDGDGDIPQSGAHQEKTSADTMANGETPPTGKSGSTDEKQQIQEAISKSTREGGLKEKVPADFRERNWKSISTTDNPFEVLFLDYRQYGTITPEMVAGNQTAIEAFWNGVAETSMDRSRRENSQKYGESNLSNYEQILGAARRKINSEASIKAEFDRLDALRKNRGYQTIADMLNAVITFGELKRKTGYDILEKGVKVGGLTDQEVYEYVLAQLKKEGFKPRAKTRSENELDNEWMTDTVYNEKNLYKGPVVKVHNIEVNNDGEIGQVLFNDPLWTKQQYIHNKVYLPTDIAKLYDAEEAGKIEKLLNEERDIDRRYLRVIYRLNPTLPFRLSNQSFSNIYELLQATAQDHLLFNDAAQSFAHGHIQAWLREADPISAEHTGNGVLLNDFLEFVYQINQSHPFYLKGERYGTTQELVSQTKHSLSRRANLSDSISNGQVFKWLNGLGQQGLLQQYNSATEAFIDSFYHSEQDKKKAAVQTLIPTLDSTVPRPAIKTSAQQVVLTNIEGIGTETFKMQCINTAGGFVKAGVHLKTAIAGVACLPDTLIFESEAGPATAEVTLSVNSLMLIKDTDYKTEIIIETVCETIVIPVLLRVVFPKRSYQLMLAKYAAVFAVLLGIVRFMVGESPDIFAHLLGIAALVAAFIYAWRLIKKVEKI